jgi:fatty acid desaturase
MRCSSEGPVTAGDLLTLEELGHLRRTSTWRGAWLVLHAWGIIADAVALHLCWPSALTLGVAVLVIGARQLGLMVLYLLLWGLPWVTWLPLLTRIRDIAEHGLVAGPDDPLRSTRSTAAGLLARAFVGPYGVNYHLEHHLLVFVPCWKLRQAHALLLARGLGERMERARSYSELLTRATTSGA